MFKFKNTYQTLPRTFYDFVEPYMFDSPSIFILNDRLANDLNIDLNQLRLEGHLYLSSNKIVNEPIAQAYAGHQYGRFTMLGDGRAMLLGELQTEKGLLDLQLKGSGPTKYSRQGDGKATLSSMLREYIISEAMYYMNVPTTQSLAVLKTGEHVYREKVEEGAILVRLSKAHIRVGTFEYALTKGKVKALADYTINRLFPYVKDYKSFLEEVIKRQAKLIAQWQSIGFIHGVLNTDNMSIVGETLDYGPCAFMDTYHERTVYSSIDRHGRYAYNQQANIGLWNLTRFSETLLSLLSDKEEDAIKIAQETLSKFSQYYSEEYLAYFSKKIGISHPESSDIRLIDDLLAIMQNEKLDFTNTFRNLATLDLDCLSQWKKNWFKRLSDLNIPLQDAISQMNQHNPSVIPRNHMVQKALTDSALGDDKALYELLAVIRSPYKNHQIKHSLPPKDNERILKTYCGT